MNKNYVNIITQEEKDRIDALCIKYHIHIDKYSINPDGSIDVDDDVSLSYGTITSIPLKFNRVSGDFRCEYNRLSSLEFCPKSVGGDFNCNNNKLTSLIGSPVSIGGFFYCHENILTSLIGSPVTVGGGFYCHENILTSVEGCPKVVGGRFICYKNRLPDYFTELFSNQNILTWEEQHVLLKYQNYYDVWTPEFNIDGMNELIAEIKDGLK
jgi:hypothetical protein